MKPDNNCDSILCGGIIQTLGPTQTITLDGRKLGAEMNPSGCVENITQSKSPVKQ